MDEVVKKSWATVEFEVSVDHEEMASWLMIQNGASGCEIKPLDDAMALVQATFSQSEISDADLSKLESSMEEYGLSSSLRSLKVSAVEDQDWLQRWKEGFRPFTIGSKFAICPPWLKNEMDADMKRDRQVIYIEPGMAFGTGLHATTQYCMTAIENEKEIGEALDVGTGSGILAIASALLHRSSKILAIDNDPESIRTSNLNLELNGVASQVELLLGITTEIHDRKYKHIFSNMTCEDIIALLPEYERLIEPGGVVFCAGVLTEKAHLLEQALASRHWKIIDRQESGIWTGLTVQY